MRVLGLASSGTEYRSRLTGVGGAMHYLFSEIARQATLVDVYQPEPALGIQAWSRLFTWSANKETWRRSYKRYAPLFQEKSRCCRKEIERRRDLIDVVLQWEFFFAPTNRPPSGIPYCVYNDWTTAVIKRLHPHLILPRVRNGIHRVERALLQNAAYVFTFTNLARQSVIEDYDVAPERVVTVGAGANFATLPDRLHRDYSSTHPVILLVGNDYVCKGVDVLMRAMPLVRQQFPQCRAIVVGGSGGKNRTPVPGIEMRPGMSKEELDRLYREATLFVLPTRTEAFGHVFTEAMAYRLPCLGSDTGGVPEIIDDGRTGYLVPVGDHIALADRIVDLLQRPDLMRRLGEAGYQKVLEHYTWEGVVARMLPYLHRAAASLSSDLH